VTVDAKPIDEVSRIALTGTPRRLTSSRPSGASPRRASANSIREPVYMPELRHESTAVTMTAFITSAAPGIPICSSAAMNGDSPDLTSLHGTTQTIRKIAAT